MNFKWYYVETVLMNRIHLYTYSALLLLGAALFSPHISFAQNAAGITLVPATIERLANPGDKVSETLTVTNESGEEKEYFIYKRNIKGVEEGGVPIFAEDTEEVTGFEIIDWIALPTEPIRIAAESSYTFALDIMVPQDATPGSHFGGVFISAEPPKLREIGAGVGYEVASILSIRISGDIIDAARIRSFSTGKLFYSKKDVDFTAKIENQGNILIRPRGPLEIKSMFGGESRSLSVNESLAGVFPGTTRDFTFSWQDEGIGFGRYEAILALVYDGKDGQRTVDASLVFWIFPTKIVISIIGGFLAIFIVGYLFTKFYINQALMRAAGGRRIPMQRYRKQVGMSRFTFVFISLLSVSVLFLIAMLIFFA